MILRMASVSSYPYGFIGGQEIAKVMGTKSREHIVEYLRNLLVQQAVIGNKWLSGRKYLREPKVSFVFSKIV